MVSQLHWEDDVVWNGDDIKHKVILLIERLLSRMQIMQVTEITFVSYLTGDAKVE